MILDAQAPRHIESEVAQSQKQLTYALQAVWLHSCVAIAKSGQAFSMHAVHAAGGAANRAALGYVTSLGHSRLLPPPHATTAPKSAQAIANQARQTFIHPFDGKMLRSIQMSPVAFDLGHRPR